MVKIRLRRTGAKKKPSYRVVAAQSTAPRDGRFIENLGYYIPTQDPVEFQVDEDRLFHWLTVGAQPTDSVNRLLKSHGLLDKFAQAKTGEQVQAEVAETEAEAEAETA